MKKAKESKPEAPVGHEDYRLKEMADQLLRAHEIQNDDDLMKKLQPHLHKKLRALKSLSDLKKSASSRIKEIQEDEAEA